MKKLLAITLALILAFSCVSVLPLTAAAAETETQEIATKKAVYIGKTGTEKRIANIFYAISEKEDTWSNDWTATDGYLYFELTFKAKMLSGAKPYVSFIRRGANSSTSGSQTEPTWVTNGYSYGAGKEPKYISYNYNPDTYECKVVFAIEPYILNWAAPWGFIAIGNVESNGTYQSEYDFDASMIIADPELYVCYPEENDVGTTNLLKDFSDANMNMSSAYVHRGNSNTTASDLNSIGRAPASKWSVQATPSLVKHIEVPADFFEGANATFTKHAETDTTREYYTSDSYPDMYFEKLGNTYRIIEDINKKMMVITANKPGEIRTANIALPMFLDQYFATSEAPVPSSKKCYVKVTFKAKRLAGNSQPMLTRLYGDTKTFKTTGAGACAYNITAGESGLPKSTYNPQTGEFVGWVRHWRGSAGQLFPNGINEVLLIGNSEIASNGADTCYESSFAISDIKVDLYGENTSTLIKEDIAPDFYAENIYDDYGYVASTNTANSDKNNRSVARADANKWSVQGDPYMINDYNVNGCFLANHTLKYNAETNSTIKHYHCATCDKNYADPYASEVLDDVSATQKMIMVKSSGTAVANAIMPLDFLDWDTANDQYYVFKCKMKLFGEKELPSISVMRPTYDSYRGAYSETSYTGYGNTGSTLWSSYDEETMTYTAVIKLYFSSCSDYWAYYLRSPESLAHQAILLGNAKHVGNGLTNTSFNTSFAFTDPQLYKLKDASDITSIDGEDLCTNITDKSLNFGEAYKYSNINSSNEDTSPSNIMAAPANKWSIDGYSNFITAYDVPENFFGEDTDAKMLRISGSSGNSYAVNYETVLEPGATYQFDIDYRNYGGSKIVITPQVAVTSFGTIANADRTYTSANVDGSHMSFQFTMPTNARISSSSSGNFKLYLGRQWDASNAGSVYFANVQLRKVTNGTLGDNIIYDGDFSSPANNTVITTSNLTNNLIGWADQSVSSYAQTKIMDIPEDFFEGDTKEVKDMAIKFNGGDWHSLQFKVNLEANTTYRLTYNYRAFEGAPTLSYQKGGDAKGTLTINDISSHTDDEYLQTYELVTSEDYSLATNNRTPNTRILLNFGTNSYDREFYIANVKLHKVVDGKIVGVNIIGDYNPIYSADVYEGIEDGIALTLGQDDIASSVSDLAHGWFGNFGTDENVEQYASLVKVADDFFAYTAPAAKLVNYRKYFVETINDLKYIDYDINGDGDITLKDLVRFKKEEAQIEGAQTEAGILLDKIMNAPNTEVTGTAYYVSNKGNDSNDGKSPDTPFATITKAISVARNGNAILLNRGDEWRVPVSTNDTAYSIPEGVTLGAYGEGDKPLINGSAANYAEKTWTNVGGNVWKTSIVSGKKFANTPGNIYFYKNVSDDEPALIGTIIKDGKIISSKNDLTQEGDMFKDYDVSGNWLGQLTNGSKNDVYVYCTENPANKYKRIEIGEERTVLYVNSNTKVDNIALKHAGGHGIATSKRDNITITNCEIGYVGGAPTEDGVLGNGIQFGLGGENLVVENCYVYECCDAGITFQSWGETGSKDETEFKNVYFTDNLLINNYYNIEFFTTGTSDYKVGSNNKGNGKFTDIYITGNIMRFAGDCWSFDQRLADEGNYRCANLCVTSNAYYINTSNLNIKDNIFDSTMSSHVYWTWADVTAEVDKTAHVGLNVSGNAFYQKAGSADSRVMRFGNVTGFAFASSQYGLEEAVAMFDSNPANIDWIENAKF